MTAVSEAQPRHHLLKILGVSFGVAVAVGSMIGSGILRAPSAIAGLVPGAGMIMGLWALGGIHAALGANVQAELTTALPRAGGPYVFARRAFGDIGGLIVGWSDCISMIASIAATSVSFAEFLPLVWPWALGHKIGVAIAMQATIYGANMLGLREGRALQATTSTIKALMLVVFVIVAFVLVQPLEGHASLAAAPVLKFAGLVIAYQLVRGAYTGWGKPVFFSEETEANARSVPLAMGIGLALATALYLAINAALLHALGPSGVAAGPLPFSAVLSHFGGGIPALLFALTAMITVASCANANIMSVSRVLFALSRDRLLPARLQTVNAGGSPDAAYALAALGSLLLALTGKFALVFGLIGTLNTVTGVMVGASLFVLRRREPDLPRPFRAFLYPALPLLVLVVDVVLLVLFVLTDYVGGVVALCLGLVCVPLAMLARRANRAER